MIKKLILIKNHSMTHLWIPVYELCRILLALLIVLGALV